LLRKALEVNPDFWQARLDLANVIERRGLRPAADAERTKALATATAAGVEEAARAKAHVAERMGMGPDAAAAWRDVLRLDARGNDVRRRVAELAAFALDRDGAVGVLDEIASWNPYDTSARMRKAEILEGAGDFALAEKALRDALGVAPEDDDLLQALGRVQSKSGRDKEALATWREALRVNPKLQAIERYIEFLDPEAAPYEDDYRVDVAPLVAKAKDHRNAENDGWITLLDHTVTKVNRDGTSSTYMHLAAKILTDAGKRRFDVFRAPGWGGESFKWKLARVLKPDGSVVDAKTNVRPGMNVADFPPLEQDDVVDLEFRMDDREQSYFGDYFGETNYFADQVPLLQSTWTLITPAEREFFFHQRNMDVKPVVATRDDGKSRTYTWSVTDVAKIRPEPMMPGPREMYPQVQVTTYRSWDEFAKWWAGMIRDQYIVSPEIKQKVQDLVAGKESRLDRIRAVYDFVTGEITYQAWAFGVHGYKPYTTTAIFDKKEGDCKDKALLFNAMLSEIGIEAHPVLIYADDSRGEEDLTLPMVNHFNHCIAYVPDSDGKGTPMWFDGTAEYASAMLPPSMDQGAKVIVVTPQGAQMKEIPRAAPDASGIAQSWDVTVNADGSALAKGELTFKGDLAVFLRSQFSVEGQREQILTQMFTQFFGKLKLVSQEFDDLKDLSKPYASFRVTLELPTFAKGSGDDLTLQTGFVDFAAGFVGRIAQRPTREHDMVLPNPMSFRTQANYMLPPGWTVTAAPEDAKIDASSATFVSQAKQEAGRLDLVREVQLVGTRVKVAEYPAFRDALNRAAAAARQQWKVRKAEAAAAPKDAPAPQPPKSDGDGQGAK
jgi:tetratricopeptide (TPR) repeat protein